MLLNRILYKITRDDHNLLVAQKFLQLHIVFSCGHKSYIHVLRVVIFQRYHNNFSNYQYFRPDKLPYQKTIVFFMHTKKYQISIIEGQENNSQKSNETHHVKYVWHVVKVMLVVVVIVFRIMQKCVSWSLQRLHQKDFFFNYFTGC